jgi:hypothetical protein
MRRSKMESSVPDRWPRFSSVDRVRLRECPSHGRIIGIQVLRDSTDREVVEYRVYWPDFPYDTRWYREEDLMLDD